LLPPGIAGYDPAYRNPYRQTNLERAKRLLAEAGYPGGLDPATGEKLTIFFDNAGTTPEGRQFVGLVTRQVERLGITLQSRVWRDTVWQDRVDRGEFQFTYYGWYMDYPDPENFVFLLYGPNRRPGPNHAAYQNPEYDRIFEQMRSMDDGPERLRLIHRLRDIAQEDCPWVCVVHDEDMLLNYDWLSNVKPHGAALDLAQYRGVDAARRAEAQQRWNRPDYRPLLGVSAFLILGSLPAARVVRRHSHRRQRRRA
jgi:ABC-type transport system substrate-binding protein